MPCAHGPDLDPAAVVVYAGHVSVLAVDVLAEDVARLEDAPAGGGGAAVRRPVVVVRQQKVPADRRLGDGSATEWSVTKDNSCSLELWRPRS